MTIIYLETLEVLGVHVCSLHLITNLQNGHCECLLSGEECNDEVPFRCSPDVVLGKHGLVTVLKCSIA